MCDAILEKKPNTNNDMLMRLIHDGYISIQGEKLFAEFPVFSQEMFDNTIWSVLKPLAEDVCGCMMEVCDIAAQTLKKYIPKELLPQGDLLAFIRHQMDVMALIIETLVTNNFLSLPKEKEKLCVFGVKR